MSKGARKHGLFGRELIGMDAAGVLVVELRHPVEVRGSPIELGAGACLEGVEPFGGVILIELRQRFPCEEGGVGQKFLLFAPACCPSHGRAAVAVVVSAVVGEPVGFALKVVVIGICSHALVEVGAGFTRDGLVEQSIHGLIDVAAQCAGSR